MKHTTIFAILMVAALSACATFAFRQRVGTFTYEGVEYPVFKAVQELFGRSTDVFVMYEPGADPSNDRPVAVCHKRTLDECKTIFGKILRGDTGTKTEGDGGMGY